MQEQEKERLHYKLLADIGDHMTDEHLPTFKTKLKHLLKPTDLAPNKTTKDVLESMISRGHMRVGNYSKLKKALEGDHEDIIDLIEDTERKMGIKVDNTEHEQSPSGSLDSIGEMDTKGPNRKDNKQLHCDLIAEINAYLNDDVKNLDRFKTRMRSQLKPQDLAPNKTFLNIAESMENRGLLKVGYYDILIEALRGDQEDIVQMIERTLKKMEENNSAAETKTSSKNEEAKAVLSSHARKRKEISENDGGSISITENKRQKTTALGGENFRKMEESALDYEEVYNIIQQNVCNQIGIIEISGNNPAQGTGFRVGTDMVMSAYHVFEPRLDFAWEEIAYIVREHLDKKQGLQSLKIALSHFFGVSDQENGADQDKLKLAISYLHKWRASAFPMKTFNDLLNLFEDHKTLPKAIETYLKGLTEIGTITFGHFKKSGRNKVTFKLNLNTPFYSIEDDVILVKLVEDADLNVPDPFSLNKSPSLSSSVHIIGHPDNKRLQFDPGCAVYTKKEAIEQDIAEAKAYCELKCKDETSKIKLINSYNRLQKDYNSGRFVVFHSSRSISHGASGSPGIVMDGEEPKVQVMLQQGHPGVVYQALTKNELECLPARCFFESGLSMKRLYELLPPSNIREDIFRSRHVSMEH